jgi:predicted alpha/beta hydrolase family esterase
MGHSTGSQDVIHYLTHNSSSRAQVQGGIMQAPASDREYFAEGDDPGVNAWNRNLTVASRMMEEGKGDKVMDDEACKAMGITITAYRLWSLLSEV